MNKLVKNNLIGDFIVVLLTLFLFWGFCIPSLIDFHKTIHKTVRGFITGYNYNQKESSYFYYTNMGDTLNSIHYFKNSSELNLKKGDLIAKYPHSLDLYIFKLNKNEELIIEPKIVGSYKWNL